MSLLDHFPFKNPDGSPAIRPAQEQALATIEKAVADGKRYIIIEAPTGVGKSGIAEAVADAAAKSRGGCYILSTQKSLTKQYMDDFGPAGRMPCGLLEMRGRSNFSCTVFDGKNCKDGDLMDCREYRTESAGDKTYEHTPCPYTVAKREFIAAGKGVTNFAYFLSEVSYVGALPEREYLVIDECHNVEKEILSFAGFDLTVEWCRKLGISEPPRVTPGENNVIPWLEESVIPVLEAKIQRLTIDANRAEGDERARLRDWAQGLQTRLDKCQAYCDPDSSMADWVVYTEDQTGSMVFKPFTAAKIAQQKLFRMATKAVILMSATILDMATFMKNLGIPESDAVCLSLDSEFPVENRPVYGWFAGNMNRDSIDSTLPKLCRRVETILDKAPNLKGIIHTHSYKVQKAVVGHLARTKHAYRIITHTSAPGSREGAIQIHRTSPNPTILVSPSMAEGLDLKDDLSRVQIICKTPYPGLDPYIVARKTHDPKWYLTQTGLALVQASGRSVRNKKDWAMTVVLDAGFAGFFRMHSYLLSGWWTKSVKLLKDEAGLQTILDFLKERAA